MTPEENQVEQLLQRKRKSYIQRTCEEEFEGRDRSEHCPIIQAEGEEECDSRLLLSHEEEEEEEEELSELSREQGGIRIERV